jgi:hypothetical protein
MAQQCPDRQLLSVYFDGEMPSPWKEKMESHIAGCPRCARQLELYRRISATAAEDVLTEQAIETAKERVWHKLEQRTVMAAGPAADFETVNPAAKPTVIRGRAVWRRRVSIPLPAAAAAVILFIALAFLAALKIMKPAESSGMTLASETEFDAPDIVPVSDMENVLQYLSSRDNGEIIILRLPESRSFVNYGEPAIVRAADYSRQAPGRNIQGWRKP